jgi:hypothetical protein
MGNAWYVSPITGEWAESLQSEGVSVPPDSGPSSAPTPNLLFATLKLFPEYHANIRRRDHKKTGKAIYVELRRADGSFAIEIDLIRVTADDQPAGVFVFASYHKREELVRLVSKLADVCGSLVLWHDSGGERPILVSPNRPFERNATG